MLWGSEVKQLAGFVGECGAFLRILGNCPSPEAHDLGGTVLLPDSRGHRVLWENVANFT